MKMFCLMPPSKDTIQSWHQAIKPVNDKDIRTIRQWNFGNRYLEFGDITNSVKLWIISINQTQTTPFFLISSLKDHSSVAGLSFWKLSQHSAAYNSPHGIISDCMFWEGGAARVPNKFMDEYRIRPIYIPSLTLYIIRKCFLPTKLFRKEVSSNITFKRRNASWVNIVSWTRSFKL